MGESRKDFLEEVALDLGLERWVGFRNAEILEERMISFPN